MTTSLKQLIDSYDSNVVLSEAFTPPSSWYSDPRILELEQRTVFSRSWQMVGRAEQIREPGQYITCDVAGEPMLLVTGHDGVVRGFYNVCRHHAAAVMPEPQGAPSIFAVLIMGGPITWKGRWSWHRSSAAYAISINRRNGLAPVQTAIWQGWVFVKLVSNGASLEEFLGEDLTRQIQKLKLEQLSWFERRSYTVRCNWKVFIDNYLDGGYHVPHIHGALNSVLDYSAYTIETGDRFCLQSSPIVSGKADAQTSETRKGQALYYWIYPNFMINWYEGVMDTNLVVPRGNDRTEVIFDYYFTDVSANAREKNLASIAVSERIQDEDVAICESVQRGLSSRSYSTGRLSVRREAGEHLFHRLLHADLKTGLPNDAANTAKKPLES